MYPVDTTQYEIAHNAKPRGTARWAFEVIVPTTDTLTGGIVTANHGTCDAVGDVETWDAEDGTLEPLTRIYVTTNACPYHEAAAAVSIIARKHNAHSVRLQH